MTNDVSPMRREEKETALGATSFFDLLRVG
jgi:hypothetical protein